jgi:hypothetical protein
MLGAK